MLPFDSQNLSSRQLFNKTSSTWKDICIFRLFSFLLILDLRNYYEIYVMKISSLVSNYFNLDKDFFLFFVVRNSPLLSSTTVEKVLAVTAVFFSVCRSWMAASIHATLFIFPPQSSVHNLMLWDSSAILSSSRHSLRTLARINAVTWRTEIKSLTREKKMANDFLLERAPEKVRLFHGMLNDPLIHNFTLSDTN